MIDKTEAVVLRVTPFSRTSHIVTWLSPDYGRLVTVVKGACRPKSLFLGQYDLFYTCEVLFYTRDRNGLHILKECAPLETRTAFRAKWRAYGCASYICDLLSRVSRDVTAESRLYGLATRSLDFLCRTESESALLPWFEMALLDVLGIAPQLDVCPGCASPVPPELHSLAFSVARGGVLCAHCARNTPADAQRIAPDVLSILRRWQRSGAGAVAGRVRCTARQLVELRRVLGLFLNYHLETGILPGSRRIAYDLAVL